LELKPNNLLDQNLYKGILPLYVILPIFPEGIGNVSDEQSKKKKKYLYYILTVLPNVCHAKDLLHAKNSSSI